MSTLKVNINNKIEFTLSYTYNASYSATHASVATGGISVLASTLLAHSYDATLYVYRDSETATEIGRGSVSKTTGAFTPTSGAPATVTIPKTHSSANHTFSFRVDLVAQDDHSVTHRKTASVSLSVPAKTSYKVTFYANGGSGAPSQQTKWHGEALTLTTAKPTRTGWDFVRWNTQPGGGGTNYSSGGTVAANTNGALNLYAVWSLKTYTITYNKNGGASGTTNSQTKTYGTPLTLRANGFTGQTNMGFDTWNTKADGTGTSYQAAQTDGYTANASATMYAIWKQIYASPKLTIKKAYRCDSGGSPDDEGTYLAVEATYTLYDTGNNAVSSWTLSCNGQTTTTPASGGTGLSGNVKMVLNANLNVNAKYTATLTLVDTAGGSGNKSTNTTSKTVSIGTAAYPIDVLAGGGGVAIGGVARRDGWLDVGSGFSAAFHDTGRFDTTDVAHSFQYASSENEYGNKWQSHDSRGVDIGYSQIVNTPTGVYRSFAVKNPRTDAAMAIYLYANDDGNVFGRLIGNATWEAEDIPNGMPASKITSDSTGTISDVITAASGWTISSVTANRWGKLCSLSVSAKKNAAIDYPATGDIANQVIGTLKTGYRPSDYAPGICSTYPGWALLYTNGEVRWLTAQPRSAASTIAANTEIYLRFHYMLA